MHKTFVTFCSIALWGVFAGGASGQCGAGAAGRASFAPRLSLPETQTLGAGTLVSAATGDDSANSLIVGLWDVTWQQLSPAPVAFFDEGYDQFHSDGTEILNDTPAPASGNVCLGVFVRTGPLSFKLHHVFWNFDSSGNLIGRGTWDSNITVNKSGASYTGTWTFNNYNLAGVLLLPVVSGTLSARRITVQ